MHPVPQIGWLVAFSAGLLSFFSPCIAPVVPGYISAIAGSLRETGVPNRGQMGRLLHVCLLFMLGFTLVLVFLGTAAGWLGEVLATYRVTLARLSGLFMIALGFFVLGFIRLPVLYRDYRFHLPTNRWGGFAPVFLGAAFAFGWTPCIGPVLAVILLYAGTGATAVQGGLLLLVYSLGLAIPFILTGLGFGAALQSLSWAKQHNRAITIVSGGLLIAVGMVFVTGRIFYINLLAQHLSSLLVR